MIDLKTSFQVSSDSKNLTVLDSTVWPSDGVDRSSINLHLFVLNTLGENISPVSFLPNALTETVTSWEKIEAEDGCYKIILVAALTFNIGLPYEKNSLVSFEEELYRASKNITAGTAITAENCWYKVTGLTDIFSLTSFPNSSYVVGHFLKDDQTRSCIAEKALSYASKSCGCADTCAEIEDYHWTNLYYDAAIYSFGFSDYSDAGKFLGSALRRCGVAGSSPCNCN